MTQHRQMMEVSRSKGENIMDEVIAVAKSINIRIDRIEILCSELDEADEYQAETESNYDKEIAKAQARLAMGKIEEVDGVPIGKVSITLIPKYAAGICFEEKAAMLIAKNRTKSLKKKIDVLAATLNAKQSIFRWLSVETIEKK